MNDVQKPGPNWTTIDDFKHSRKSGKVSSRELVDSCLMQIDSKNDKLHAFVSVGRENARSTAESCDKDVLDSESLPAVHGIVLAIKDLFDWKGKPTGAGSRSLKDQVAIRSATVVEKLETAGAVLIGKTHTVEFAFGGWGTNKTMGTPWNPWDLNHHRVPGGSSSGSAVAVASGMAVAALGTDTGGSVRTPACYCGLFGIKTSLGLISRHGVYPLCPTHDSVGVLARSVSDAAHVLNVISGPDPKDPATLDAPEVNFRDSLHAGVKGLRIGVLSDQEMGTTARDVRKHFDCALDALSSGGAKIMLIDLPHSLLEYLELGGRLMSAESYSSLREIVDSDQSDVDPSIRARVLAGKSITQNDYEGMLEQRLTAQQAFAERMQGYDAIVTPTCSETAIRVDKVDETRVVTPFGRFVNYLDLAATTVPIGVGADKMPVGIQVVVSKYKDPLAIQISQFIEDTFGTLRPRGL